MHATQARLGESASEVPPELFVRGTVQAEERGFVVTLTMKDASGHAAGERRVRVEHQSCKEVARPTSLVLAMMIAVADSHVETRATDEPTETTTAPDPAPSTSGKPHVPPPARAPPPTPPRSHRLFVGVAGIASLGLLPSVGHGVAVRASYARSPITFGVEASFENGGTVHVGSGSAGFQLYRLATRVGFTMLSTSRLELALIVGMSFAAVSASAAGFPTVRDDVRTTALVGPGILGRLAVAPSLFAEVLPELEGVVLRDRFMVRGVDGLLLSVHQPSTLAGRLSLGLSYEFR